MREWSVGTEEPLFSDGFKRTAWVRTPWGWRVEAWLHINRPRMVRVGGGIWLREPWGFNGALTAASVTVWCVAIGFGVREKEPPIPAYEWDEDDDTTTQPFAEESPDAP